MLKKMIAVSVGSAVFLVPAVPETVNAEQVKAVTRQVSTRAIPATTVVHTVSRPAAVKMATLPRLIPPSYLRGYPKRKWYAKHYMYYKHRWGTTQYSCFNKIIVRESNWGIKIKRMSGPGGLGQANPASRMKRFGNPYNYRIQIIWTVWYIKHRHGYGTPCRAWRFWQAHGWY